MYPGIEDLGEDFCEEIYVPRDRQVRWEGNSAAAWSSGRADVPRQPFRSLLPPRPPPAAPTVFDIETEAQARRRDDIVEATKYVGDADARGNISEWGDLFRSHECEPIIVVDRATLMTRMVTIGLWIAYRLTCRMQKIEPNMIVAPETVMCEIPWGFYTLPPLDYLPELPRGYFDEVLKYLRSEARM